jgi:hypothetical protein
MLANRVEREGLDVPKMTAEREAAYALDFGVSRRDLSPAAQLAYDRLKADREASGHIAQASPAWHPPRRSSPETRARILEMFKRSNDKYASPFEEDRLASASLLGTESWAEYGQVVLSMAILETMLSIEEKLSTRDGATGEAADTR